MINAENYDFSNKTNLVEALYKFQEFYMGCPDGTDAGVESTAKSTMQQVSHLNNFLGIDIGSHPWGTA